MAEAPERPAGSGEAAVTTPPHNEAVPGPGWPGAPPAAGAAEAEPYRPVPVPAIAGFVLAVLYAAVVCLGGVAAWVARYPRGVVLLTLLVPGGAALAAGLARVRQPGRLLTAAGYALGGLYAGLGVAGLVAFSGSSPWLLPGWTLVVPLAAVLCCWIARGQIQRSEGTLGGSALAGWGVGLALVFGLNYLAYYASTTFAIRQQAREFTREWLEMLRQGKLEEAFLRTVPYPQRPGEGEDLRTAIEVKFNGPSGRQGTGAYTEFTQRDFVRLIVLSGERTEIVPGENVSWEYVQGAYKVTLDYRVRTEMGTMHFNVAALGSEPAEGGGGRQWQVLREQTRPLGMEPARKGMEIEGVLSTAGRFGMNWVGKVGQRELDEAYLDTLPAARREGQRLGWGKCELPVPALGDPQAREFLEGRAPFRAGGLVRADPARFWAAKEFREEIVREVKKVFAPDFGGWQAVEGAPQQGLTIQQVRVPWWEWGGGMLRVRLAAQVRIPHRPDSRALPTHPRFLVEGELVLETPAGPGQFPRDPAWRVVTLDLRRGHSAGPGGPAGPGRDGPPGPGGPPAPGGFPPGMPGR